MFFFSCCCTYNVEEKKKNDYDSVFSSYCIYSKWQLINGLASPLSTIDRSKPPPDKSAALFVIKMGLNIKLVALLSVLALSIGIQTVDAQLSKFCPGSICCSLPTTPDETEKVISLSLPSRKFVG